MSLMSDCELGGWDHAAADVGIGVRGIHEYVSKSCLFKLSDVKLECHGSITLVSEGGQTRQERQEDS